MEYLIKLFGWLWICYLKPWWSSLLWFRKRRTESAPILEVNEDNVTDVAAKLYRGYTWTADGIAVGIDSYHPAQYAYTMMYTSATENTSTYKKDCDGFHVGMLHLLTENSFDAAIVTVLTKPITHSHTMTVYRRQDEDGSYRYYILNYTALSGPHQNLQDFVDGYTYPVRSWYLQGWNTSKRKYYNIAREWGGSAS